VDQGYLRNGSPREKAHVHPEGCYPDQAIELVTGTTVTAIDPARWRITIDDGRELVHDRLLPTTGAAPRPMPLPGADPTGVHYLRMLADCDASRGQLDVAGSLVVIGAGPIGAELPASARQRRGDRHRASVSAVGARAWPPSSAACTATRIASMACGCS
jgi:3-phenylpropionate/trans-cinnamate dioxygenase ferredoxin reductase subunit